MMKRRCAWAGSDPLYVKYHDLEWGVPVHRDRKLFQMLTPAGAQAGLSWLTILRKREHYRSAFDRFDPQKVSRYDRRKIERLMQDAGIVRNRAKIESTVANAKAFLAIRKEFAESIEANSVHGSDSPENAAIEIAYFFSGTEIVG